MNSSSATIYVTESILASVKAVQMSVKALVTAIPPLAIIVKTYV